MASSSAQDKNLPASPRKLEKARAEGQVARSRDLGHFAAVAGGGAALVAAAPRVSDWLRSRSPARFASTAPRRCATTMTSQLLGWATTCSGPSSVRHRHGGLRDRQRAGDGRLDLDVQATRPEVPRPRSAFRPRPVFSSSR
jgi:hypothetical protein